MKVPLKPSSSPSLLGGAVLRRTLLAAALGSCSLGGLSAPALARGARRGGDSASEYTPEITKENAGENVAADLPEFDENGKRRRPRGEAFVPFLHRPADVPEVAPAGKPPPGKPAAAAAAGKGGGGGGKPAAAAAAASKGGGGKPAAAAAAAAKAVPPPKGKAAFGSDEWKAQWGRRKFLFPLLDQGPNNQYLQFRVAMSKAHSLNRTLVLPVWLPHNPKFQHYHPGAPPQPPLRMGDGSTRASGGRPSGPSVSWMGSASPMRHSLAARAP